MIIHTKPKISGLIHTLNEILNSSITPSYKSKLLTQVERDLAQEGSHAAITGKIHLQRYYQSLIDNVVDSESMFETMSDESQSFTEYYTELVLKLDREIEQLEAKQLRPSGNDPSQENLLHWIDQSSSIEGAQLLTFKPDQRGVLLFPFLENSILLTKKDLKSLLQIIDNYNPEING